MNQTNKMAKDISEILNDKKGLNLDRVWQFALTDRTVLNELLQGQVSKNETYRYNCFKVLYKISEKHPHVLYPDWNYLVELLSSTNSYHKMAAINIIANLTQIDDEKRFEKIFHQFFKLLDDPSMIVAIYVAQNSGKIAKWNPGLRSRITERLLDIDKTHHEPDRKDLIKAGAIESFEEIFKLSEHKEKIIAFVKTQVNGKSPKTRKIAKNFLNKHSLL